MDQKCYVLEVDTKQAKGWSRKRKRTPDTVPPKFVEVEGEAIEIKGVRAFVVNVSFAGIDTIDWWRVYDLETGMRLSDCRPEKSEAIDDAREKLVAVSVGVYQKQQSKSVALFGKSPAVAE